MIVTALELVSEAAGRIGDPNRRRVVDSLWLPIVKQVVRSVCMRGLPILEIRATFDITTDDRYGYPDNLVTVSLVSFSPDPTNPDNYYDLIEKDRDWLREQTQSQYAIDEPRFFVPLPSWFHLYPKHGTGVTDGGRMDYLAVPDLPTNVETGTVELPAPAVNHIIEGMAIEGLKSLKMYDLAAAREGAWLAYELDLATLLRGRSTDRKKRLSPALGVVAARQV